MHYCVNAPQVINEIIDGEAIMINLATGTYYSLNKTGAEIWGMIERTLPLHDIVADLERRYDAPGTLISAAVDSLLKQLSHEQLIVQQDDGGGAPSRHQSFGGVVTSLDTSRMPFTPPRLEKFTDMQDLILLDPVHEVDSRGWPHLPEGRASR